MKQSGQILTFFHKADLQMELTGIESDASLQSWLLFLEETRQGQEKSFPHFCGAQLPPRAHHVLASAAGSGKCQLSFADGWMPLGLCQTEAAPVFQSTHFC